MSLLIMSRQLQQATYELATDLGSVQERLAKIWYRYIRQLELEDAPRGLSKGLVSLQTNIRELIGENGAVPGSFALIPESRSIDLIHRVLFLSDDLFELFVIKHYKQMLS